MDFCNNRVCGSDTGENAPKLFTNIYKEITIVSAPK